MASPAQIVTFIFVILGLLGLIRWWRLGFKRYKRPIWIFVVGVAVVWAIILSVAWFTGGQTEFDKFWTICRAYFIGMLVMYIGTRVYKS